MWKYDSLSKAELERRQAEFIREALEMARRVKKSAPESLAVFDSPSVGFAEEKAAENEKEIVTADELPKEQPQEAPQEVPPEEPQSQTEELDEIEESLSESESAEESGGTKLTVIYEEPDEADEERDEADESDFFAVDKGESETDEGEVSIIPEGEGEVDEGKVSVIPEDEGETDEEDVSVIPEGESKTGEAEEGVIPESEAVEPPEEDCDETHFIAVDERTTTSVDNAEAGRNLEKYPFLYEDGSEDDDEDLFAEIPLEPEQPEECEDDKAQTLDEALESLSTGETSAVRQPAAQPRAYPRQRYYRTGNGRMQRR